MARYKSENIRPISRITPEQRLSNQVVLSGTDDTYPVTNGAFYLEYLEAGTTVNVLDGDGNTICTGIAAFSNDHVPLRCDGGIEIVGAVTIAKGFFLGDVLV
jgi:hypothetical protein